LAQAILGQVWLEERTLDAWLSDVRA